MRQNAKSDPEGDICRECKAYVPGIGWDALCDDCACMPTAKAPRSTKTSD